MSEHIHNISAGNLVTQCYAEYGRYVNQHRAIPHIGDGLIPVYRRILLAASKYSDWTLSQSIVADTLRDYHGHGSASVEPVLSTLVRQKLLMGKGNHGLELMTMEKAAAPRYTKARRSDEVNSVLLRLKDYSPGAVNELNHYEPDYLITPIPLALVYGHFGIGIGCNSTIPAFTYDSLVRAHREDDFTKLRPQYSLSLVQPSEVRELWETGYGRLTYKMNVDREWSDSDECYVTVIEGSGVIFQPKIREALEDHIQAGRVWCRDESTTSIRLVIGRYPRVRAISDDEIFEIAEKCATFSKVYDIKVAVKDTVRRVGIKDWMDVTQNLYIESNSKWQDDSIVSLVDKAIRDAALPTMAPELLDGADDDRLLDTLKGIWSGLCSTLNSYGIEVSSDREATMDDITEMLRIPVRRLRKFENSNSLQKYADEIAQIKSYDIKAALEDAAAVLRL